MTATSASIQANTRKCLSYMNSGSCQKSLLKNFSLVYPRIPFPILNLNFILLLLILSQTSLTLSKYDYNSLKNQAALPKIKSHGANRSLVL